MVIGMPDDRTAALIKVGRRIRAGRIALDLTQARFAQLCFVTQAAVSQWERGVKLPRRPMQHTIADVLRQPRHLLFAELDALEEAAA